MQSAASGYFNFVLKTLEYMDRARKSCVIGVCVGGGGGRGRGKAYHALPLSL